MWTDSEVSADKIIEPVYRGFISLNLFSLEFARKYESINTIPETDECHLSVTSTIERQNCVGLFILDDLIAAIFSRHSEFQTPRWRVGHKSSLRTCSGNAPTGILSVLVLCCSVCLYVVYCV